jgi:hypothetical protein
VPEGKSVQELLPSSSSSPWTETVVREVQWLERQPPSDSFSPSSCTVTQVPPPPSSLDMESQGQGCDLVEKVASNKGWGIPPGQGLKGGGLNSLNNGTSGWGAPPSNQNAGVTGWGAPPGPGQAQPQQGAPNPNQPNAPAPPPPAPSSSSPPNPGAPANNNHQSGSNQWASNSPNRNASQNTNGQQIIPGQYFIFVLLIILFIY